MSNINNNSNSKNKLSPDVEKLVATNKAKKYMDSVKHLNILLVISIVLFYIVPKIVFMTGISSKVAGFIVILILMLSAFVVFLMNFSYCLKFNFNILVPIVIAVLYVPSVIINYGGDKGMFSFVFIYLFMGICGLFTGNVLRRRQYNEKQPLGLNTALKMQRMREEKAKKDKVLKRKHTKKKHKKK